MTSYQDITEEAKRDAVRDTVASIVQEAELLLTAARNPDNSLAAIKELAEPLIDQVFALEITLDSEGDEDGFDVGEDE